MRNSMMLSCLAVLLLAAPALAGDKKKKGGGDEAAPPPPPAETEAPKKNKKNKDKAEEAPAAPAAPAPAEAGKGALKPGQGVGVRACLGSTANVNVEATSKSTVGVATCRGELQKAFVAKGLCSGKKGAKLEYSWQFADTTGTYTFTCP
jgi:hypothetical protein